MANDFFAFVYDCILFEHVGFGPVKGTTVYLHELFRAFAYIARLYALSPTDFNVQQDVFRRYLGLHYADFFEDDIPKLHPLFLVATTIFHPPRGDPYLSVPALHQAHREKFLWRYARQVPAKYQDDIALLIKKLRRDIWHTVGKGKTNVKIYRRIHNQSKIQRQLDPLKVDRNPLVIQGSIGIMIAQPAIEVVPTAESRLSLLDAAALDKTKMAEINKLMRLLQKTTVSTPTRAVQIARFTTALESSLRTRFSNPGLRLHITGSYANGLSAMSSDVDVTLTGPTQGIDVRRLTRSLPPSCEDVLAIADARVPIVTFWYRRWDIFCDISINQKPSIYNSKLVKTYAAIDPRLQTIWFSLKHLAKKQGILSAKDGFLSSYALTMMLITYLQTRSPPVLPRLQQSQNPILVQTVDGIDCSFDQDWRSHVEAAQWNRASSGELLVGLLRYFGHQFDYSTMEVNPRLGQFRAQGASRTGLKRSGGFSVMDPFLVDRNVAGMCRGANVVTIKLAFQKAHRLVLEDPHRALSTSGFV
ncbi:hypothetical protein BGZ70_008427 [Mortierella alpina]|uniref:Poly(A) RNA polymerase mitochondrial-like central palm domain-containing protein n=1 Tax=Mortierella alpina TaxID=64518 RepID=A0A9P6J5S8_MORAP|nr:hypothetical protein BGZ70_008427 [Mortierella alpina]